METGGGAAHSSSFNLTRSERFSFALVFVALIGCVVVVVAALAMGKDDDGDDQYNEENDNNEGDDDEHDEDDEQLISGKPVAWRQCYFSS